MSPTRHANRVHRMMAGDDRTPTGRAYRAAASLIEPIYTGVVAARNRRYDAGRGVRRAHVPVVSIGNLTTGGTGKTPMAVFIVQRLLDLGCRPAVLTRGYKAGRAQTSDEATLLAEILPGVPVILNPDRVAGAAQVQRDHAMVDVLVLDDGFQHRRLARDVDLVLIDATCPFGHGRLLPRGMLREPVNSLRRATAVLVTHAERIDAETLAALDQRIAEANGKPPTAHFAHAWAAVEDADGNPIDASGRRIVAACAVGNPAAFFDEAASRADVVARGAFGDHHDYSTDDLRHLTALARQHHAEALLVTEKDWVKLRPLLADADAPPVWHSVLELRPTQSPDAIDALLQVANIRSI